MKLTEKIAVLTGASSGLGRAIAKALVNKGVIVYGLGRNNDALEDVKKELGSYFHPVQMDISVSEGIQTWIENTFSKDYAPDILINNAGIGSFQAIDEIKTEEWNTMVNTNLNGTYYITSKIVPFFKAKKESSHLINIGSILGTMGRAEGAAYCATKHAISGFSDALFKELRFFNTKVTCFNPGSIDTHFFQTSGIKKHSNMLQPNELAETLIHILETPDNMLINEMTVRPLNPKEQK